MLFIVCTMHSPFPPPPLLLQTGAGRSNGGDGAGEMGGEVEDEASEVSTEDEE